MRRCSVAKTALPPRKRTTLALVALAAASLGLRPPGTHAGPPPIELVFVPATDDQPGGPAYDFRIGRFEIGNDQFVAFLNDALANLDNEKGRYLYFDLDTGNVHIGADLVGQAGIGGTGPLLFDAAINGHVAYIQGGYVVTDPVFAAHPVTGVTWYGALKFCNWLTLASGLDASELAYAEAPAADLNGWRPVTISSAAWAVRDLTAAERDALLEKLGFRLPMDGGADGSNAYNEWLKAAAARRNPSDALVFDALYGFGRNDSPTPADANYFASGGPFEPGTAAVGFYNGVNLLTDGTPTRDTDNAYGLYDVSGNVWEWLQDQGPADPTQRRNRGGSWQSAAASVKLIPGAQRTASAAVSSTGFRIVQRVVDAMLVTPQGDVVAAGPWGGPYVPSLTAPIVYRLSNAVNQPIDFTIASDAAWVTVEPGGGSIPVGDSTEARVSIAPRCADLLPPGDNVAMLRIAFGPEPKTIERRIRLTLTEPLTLSPAENLDAGMFVGGVPTPSAIVYTLESASDQPIEWSADWEDVPLPPSGLSWLTINEGPLAQGEIPPQAATEIVVAIDPIVAAAIPVGVHQGRVTFTDDCTGATFDRTVTLRVTAPLAVAPAEESVSTGVFGGPFQPPAHTFTLTNLTNAPVDWTAGICGDAQTCTAPPEPPWLTLDHTTGTLSTGVGMDVAATLTPAAGTLTVGRHSLIVRFATTGGFTVDRVVTVEVSGLRLEPLDDGEFRGPLGGPFEPTSILYTLSNAGLQEMFWSMTVLLDPPSTLNWLDVSPSKGTILDPNGTAEVMVSLAPDAAALTTGTYFATITFDANGATAGRRITLIVGAEAKNLSVTPLTDFEAAGPTQGSIAPAYTVYRLTNIAGHGAGDIQWHVSADQPWVTINGGLSAAGSLADGSSINVVVAIAPAAAPQLSPGVSEQRFSLIISFDDQTNAEIATRSVALTLVAPKFTLDEALVPAGARQPAGPTYSFHLGRFHVTNAQFVAFLNDALANGDHLRGQYMFFHTATGDVYLNTVATGESGDDFGGRTIRMFSPGASGRIRFLNGQYEIVPQTVDYSSHPVTGVSWYGAVKFCNWLTLDQGMRPRERCYGEGPDPVAWRPMTISASDWAARDLTDDEREVLVAHYRGYRLPMDDGYNNSTPTIDSADDYNEWYKAAAWNETLRQNTLFGFGRNALTGADANYRCSGDGFEDVVNCLSGGTTPVGYYDGSVKAGAFATGTNDNTFGLFDMTGNVHQWLQGRYAPPTTIERRTLRGGSWNDPVNAQSLRTASRTLFAAPSTTSNQIGLRVVRTPAPPAADFDADGDVDLFDFAPLTACPTGPSGSASSLCTGFDFDGDVDVDLRDLGTFQNKFTGRE
jgi:formylglycine-generating enzyme required for sulfatase activity